MNIKLIDFDSKIPNLALMQISSYHKSKGDNVGFDMKSFDLIYISSIFTKSKAKAMQMANWYSIVYEVDVIVGGSGINYDWLPKDMQKIKPDYSIYPEIDYSMGFTTRGCVRNCGFCIVRKKEGTFRRWQPIEDFHNNIFEKVRLLDNNIFADLDWFLQNTYYLIENDLAVDINQGMDIRLLNEKIAHRLRELKFFKTLKFAFDNLSDEKAVRAGVVTLDLEGFNLKQDIQFYVLVGYNTTEEEDKYRCRLLKELGTNAFVMPYKRTEWTKKIARWANRKHLFWSMDIDEYKPKKADNILEMDVDWGEWFDCGD